MQDMNSSLKFKLFLISKLPLAWIAGLRNEELNDHRAVVGIKYGYWTKNPFKSIYFAVLAMAAELSSGLLVLSKVQKSGRNISTLVLGMQAEFNKKATGKIKFICIDGTAIDQVINDSIHTKQGKTIETTSIGYNEKNEQVAKFTITWTVKCRD